MELVMEVCDLIWVLDAGKVIAAGSPRKCATTRLSWPPTWAKTTARTITRR